VAATDEVTVSESTPQQGGATTTPDSGASGVAIAALVVACVALVVLLAILAIVVMRRPSEEHL
jgi:hypothetical protein